MRTRILLVIAVAVLAGAETFGPPLRAQNAVIEALQIEESRARAAGQGARAESLRKDIEAAQREESRARAVEELRAEAMRRELVAATGDLEQKVISVQHADVQALAGIFRDWVVSIRASRELKLLTVAGKAEAIARLEQAIKELDVPGRWTEGGSEITKSFTLTNATSPQELHEIAATLRGTLDLRGVSVVNSTNTLVIRGRSDQLTIAQEVIAATDKPRPQTTSGNVEFVVQLIEGIDQATPGPPKGLEEVIRQLSNTFPYGGYRLMETFVVRTKVGDSSAEVSGMIPNIAAEGLPPAHYNYSVRARAIVPQGSGRAIQLEAMHLNLRVPAPTGNSGQYNFTDIGIQTEMSVPEGKTVVVGKAGAAGPIRGLFLVLTAKVVE